MKKTICIDITEGGQRGRFGDTVHHAYISVRLDGHLRGVTMYRTLSEAEVRWLCAAHVRPFCEHPVTGYEPTLTVCKPVEPTDAMQKECTPGYEPGPRTRWAVRVVEPYSD